MEGRKKEWKKKKENMKHVNKLTTTLNPGLQFRKYLDISLYADIIRAEEHYNIAHRTSAPVSASYFPITSEQRSSLHGCAVL
jgi:hypothetical protein